MITRFLLYTILFCTVTLFAKTPKEVFFEKCANCHGEKADEKALGVSGIISEMTESEIVNSLIKYKAGNQDKTGMGATMQSLVSDMSEKEFKFLAKYIKTLK